MTFNPNQIGGKKAGDTLLNSTLVKNKNRNHFVNNDDMFNYPNYSTIYFTPPELIVPCLSHYYSYPSSNNVYASSCRTVPENFMFSALISADFSRLVSQVLFMI